MRKLDVPYKLGEDYFIDSKLNVPFYQVPLYREIEVKWVKENELNVDPNTDPNCVIGIFRKTAGAPGEVFTYKLCLEESKRNYKPYCRGNE